LSGASFVTAPSEYLARELRGIRKDILVIPNPIDLESYPYRERMKPAPNLIWLRAFHRIYDPVLAVQVLARVAQVYHTAKLVMIGPDKDGSLADVRSEADRLGVLDRVVFTGGIAKSEVPGMLSNGDIFLNTTTVDNVPVSLLEAMACGLGVVSTDAGGIPYLLDTDENGIIVPAGDAGAMAGAVTRILREPGLAARLSRGARLKAESYTWSVALPQWETLLLKLAGA
jgi:glycosyltransferase involved in cell wall biosynthesis